MISDFGFVCSKCNLFLSSRMRRIRVLMIPGASNPVPLCSNDLRSPCENDIGWFRFTGCILRFCWKFSDSADGEPEGVTSLRHAKCDLAARFLLLFRVPLANLDDAAIS